MILFVVIVANFQEANDFLLRIFVHFLADFYVTSVLAPRVTRLQWLTRGSWLLCRTYSKQFDFVLPGGAKICGILELQFLMTNISSFEVFDFSIICTEFSDVLYWVQAVRDWVSWLRSVGCDSISVQLRYLYFDCSHCWVKPGFWSNLSKKRRTPWRFIQHSDENACPGRNTFTNDESWIVMLDYLEGSLFLIECEEFGTPAKHTREAQTQCLKDPLESTMLFSRIVVAGIQ